MSEAVKAKKQMGEMPRLVLTLFGIAAVCSLLLGIVNGITAPKIEAAQIAKSEAAMAAVLPADSYEPVVYDGEDSAILSINKAADAGYVVEVACSGSFSGTLSIMVGVASDNTVTGVEIVKSAETSGLGANAKKASFRDQFKGSSGTVAVTKDGGQIDALTGATITSRAVSAGVTSALSAVAALG